MTRTRVSYLAIAIYYGWGVGMVMIAFILGYQDAVVLGLGFGMVVNCLREIRIQRQIRQAELKIKALDDTNRQLHAIIAEQRRGLVN